MSLNYGQNLTYTPIYKLQNNYKKDRAAEQIKSDTKVIPNKKINKAISNL